MKVSTDIRAGVEATRYWDDAVASGASTLGQLGEGARSLGSAALGQAGAALGGVSATVTNPKFWTWPF